MSEEPNKQPDNIIKFKLDQKRDDEIEAKQALEICGVIYTRWRNKFVRTRKHPSELAGALNELAAQLEAKVRHPRILQTIIHELIYPAMAEAENRVQIMLNTVEVAVDCPNKISINAIESPCGWGGLARFSAKQWETRTASMTCPQCGSLLTHEDMILRSDLERLAALQPKKKK